MIKKSLKESEISIILPTYNRSDVLIENMALIEKQISGVKEIIIIDDGSEQTHREALESYAKKRSKIVLMGLKHAGPAAARNLAIRKAKGQILLFINDDTTVTDGFIRRHLDFHTKNPEKNKAVIGPFIEHPKLVDTPIMKWLVCDSQMHFKYEKSTDGTLPWYYFWTCNISVKKDFVIENNLYFNETFPTAAWEDVEYGYRAKEAGLKIYYDKKLVAYHYHHFSLEDVLARFRSHGRGMYHLVGKLPNQHLPMLAKKHYRAIANVILMVTLYPFLSKILRTIFDLEKSPNSLILQYLIVGEKIKGWNYEKNKAKNNINISGN